MEWIATSELAQDLERRNVLTPNQGGLRAGKPILEDSRIRIRCLRTVPEGETSTGRGSLSGRCIQQSAVQTADGTCTIWHQLDVHKMAASCTPGKKGRHVSRKLDLHAKTTDSRTPTRLSSVPDPLQSLHKTRHLASSRTRTAQSQGTVMVRDSESIRLEGLYTKQWCQHNHDL